jgi:hypothetical protein
LEVVSWYNKAVLYRSREIVSLPDKKDKKKMNELLGLLLPPLIDAINQFISNEKIKFWVSFVICAAIGLILNFLGNHNHFTDMDGIARSILAVFGLAQIAYKGYWKDSTPRAMMLGENPNQ